MSRTQEQQSKPRTRSKPTEARSHTEQVSHYQGYTFIRCGGGRRVVRKQPSK